MRIGYKLSSEQFGPLELARLAGIAEEAGFNFAMISDHFHPWIERQGQSPFVWSVLGAISTTTTRLRVGTGVACPTMRIHPAVIAHAAATSASMFGGRFFLGLGSGENLNEHVVGASWPRPGVRLEMLEEAVGLIRALWGGDLLTRVGKYFTVDRARLYTLPDSPPPIYLAGSGPRALALAGRVGDGLISDHIDPMKLDRFTSGGGRGKPRMIELGVCWAPDAKQARREVRELWPTIALPPASASELALPSEYEEAVAAAPIDEALDGVVCGPDPERHAQAIRACLEAGYEEVCIMQFGADQEGFLRAYQRDVLPLLGWEGALA